jgi:hypothetical protein
MGIFTRKQSVAPPSVPEPEAVEYAVMPKALRISAASFKGHAPVSDDEVEKVLVAEVFPISAAINKEERLKEAAQKKAEEEAKKNLRPGYQAGDKGIFVATIEHKDRSGKSIKLNLFSMPEDLYPSDTSGKNCRTFVDTAKEIGNRRDGLKLDPENYEKGLIAALEDGSAFGKWIIPLREWVDGKDRDGKAVAGLEKNNLYALRDIGDFKGTFTTEDKAPSPMIPNRYWSCTERRDGSTLVWYVRFSDGDGGWDDKDYGRLSCRPCRVELAL